MGGGGATIDSSKKDGMRGGSTDSNIDRQQNCNQMD